MRGRPVVPPVVLSISMLLALSIPTAAYPDLPEVTAQIHSDCAVAYGFYPGATVGWQLRDAPGGELLYDGSLQADAEGTLDFCGLGGATYEPGRELRLSDGITTKILSLLDLTIDADVDADDVFGTAPAGAQVTVNAWNNDGGTSLTVDADGDGAWSADFSGIFDIASAAAAALVADDDGDRTEVDWEAPRPPQFEVAMTPELSMPADTIFTCCGVGWREDSSVSVEVFDGAGGNSLFGPVSVATDDEGSFTVWPDELGLDLLPGMYVVVTGETTGFVKDLTLADISFDVLDSDTDSASGTAPAGSWLWVESGAPDSDNVFGFGGVQADVSGAWFADFGAQGFDITSDMGGAVHLEDEDHDTTRAGIAAPEVPAQPRIEANLTWDTVNGDDLPAGTIWALTIRNGVGGDVLVGPIDQGVNEDGEVWLDDFDFELAPGMEITLSDGTTTKVLVVEALTFDVLSAVGDTASGTASAGTTVFVDLWDSEGEGGGYAEVEADGSSHWAATAADFDPPLDVTPSMSGFAGVRDDDDDQTLADWRVPTFEGNLTWDSVSGYDFQPSGTATLTVLNGPDVVMGPVEKTVDGDGQVWFQSGEDFEFDLTPGLEVTLTDRTSTKVVYLEPITLDALDSDTDTATGTAPAGRTVFVDVWETQGEGGGYAEVVADGSGRWTATAADFDSLDITPSMGGQAGIYDEDGDRTTAGWEPPRLPTIEASLTWDSMVGRDFSADTTTLIIRDSDSGDALLEPVDGNINDEGEFWFELGEYDFDLLPGMEVTLTDGATAKTLFLEPITFDLLDPDTDTATGTADPGTTVFVDLWESDGEGGGYAEVVADGTGHWTATAADFDGLDITPSMDGQAGVYDEDGDRTTAGWQVPTVPTIEAGLPWDSVVGRGFSADMATLTISDGETGVVLFGPVNRTINDEGEVNFDLGEYDFDLLPGMEVALTDGTTTKTLFTEPITFDLLSAVGDTASGTASAGATVFVDLWDSEGEGGGYTEVAADGTGHWTATAADFDPPLDITPSMDGQAEIFDEDGDRTTADWQQPRFEVAMTPEVSMDADFIFVCCGEGWKADPSVTVTVFDGPGGTLLFGPYSTPTDAEGSFEVGPATHGLDLVPGMHVVVAGETTRITKELTLSELTLNSLDAEADTASGTAPAGSELAVEAGLPESDEFYCCLWTQADESGNWFVDFGAEGFDITSDMGATAHLSDQDGDTTRAGIPAPEGPHYDFGGFFRPVDNRPTVNVGKAGQAVPVKFSLGGDFGLDVLAPGSPTVGAFACGSPALDPLEWTASSSESGLSYDRASGQYTYVWKTSKSWAGSCQRLTLVFNDGTVQMADFKFTR